MAHCLDPASGETERRRDGETEGRSDGSLCPSIPLSLHPSVPPSLCPSRDVATRRGLVLVGRRNCAGGRELNLLFHLPPLSRHLVTQAGSLCYRAPAFLENG